MKFNNIGVIGAGFVGTSLATLFGQSLNVTVFDNDINKINLLNKKKSPVKDVLIEKYLLEEKSKINTVSKLSSLFNKTDLYIVCLPTNYDPEKNYFNTSALESVIKEILHVEKEAHILIKSTIPVGFTDEIKAKYNSNNIVFSPEFLREGNALSDNLKPSRIVIGDSSELGQDIGQLFESFAENDPICYFMSSKEAESVKLFSNSYLALRVSYFNELDTYSMKNNLDTEKVISAVCADPRIGEGYNNPSFGYGGYCLPKDTKQLLANYLSVPQNLIGAIVDSNSSRKDAIADDIVQRKPDCVGIYRLIMKEDSGNIRESSVQGIIKRLKSKNVKVIIYEPLLNQEEFDGLKLYKSFEEFERDASLIVSNRIDKSLEGLDAKIYSRDIFREN